MEIAAQIIVAIVAGILGSFMLGFLFRYIFTKLDTKASKVDMDKKLDITAYTADSLRIADNLEAGKRRFDKLDKGFEKITDAVNQLCREFEGAKTTLENIEKKLP